MRSLKSELKQEKDAKKAPDALLREAAHIVADEVGMLKADPKLGAVILPPGSNYLAKELAGTDKPAAPASTR